MTHDTTGLSGTLLSAIKKLIRDALPGYGPSHLTEALAAGMGYKSYASLQSDIDKGPVRFCRPGGIDTGKFTARLADLTRQADDDIRETVDAAFATLSRTIDGDIIPCGPSGKLVGDDRLRPANGRIILDDLKLSVMPEWRKAVVRKPGILIVGGPAGAGKSTAVHAMLNEFGFNRVRTVVDMPQRFAIRDIHEAIRLQGNSPSSTENPYILCVDNVNDHFVMLAVIEAANAGMMVIASTRGNTCRKALFSLSHAGQMEDDLAKHVRGVLCLALLHGTDDKPVPLSECMVFETPDEVSAFMRAENGKYPDHRPDLLDDGIHQVDKGMLSIETLRRLFPGYLEERLTISGMSRSKLQRWILLASGQQPPAP